MFALPYWLLWGNLEGLLRNYKIFKKNEFGSNKCKKCPEGYITKQLGAKNIFECDQVWDGSCKPDQPEPCPNG